MAKDRKELSQPDKGLIIRGLGPLRDGGLDHPTPEKYWLREDCLEWTVVMIRSSHNLRTKSNSSRVHPTNPPLENFPKKWTWNPGERYSWMEWTCEKQVVMSNARTGLHKTLQCSAWTTILGWDRTTISKASAWGFTLSFLPGELPSVGMTDLIPEIMHTPHPKGSPQLVATLHVVQKAAPLL